MIQNIPFELQRLNQWVCAGENKLPIHPRTGKAADVTNPDTWGTFAEACACSMKHVGFVLSTADPYTIIDLDDPRKNSKGELEQDLELVKARTQRHCKILELFESYAEYSQSGNGIHIITKGRIPKGCRRDRVEVYSDSRYMICTGNPYNNLPITDQQPLLDRLFAEMSTDREEVDLVQVDGLLTDDEICRMAYNALNGAKFWQLWEGKWPGNPLYQSQSEADYALLAIIAFYTKDNEQVRRIFRKSALGKRDKAIRNDKYINIALRKIRSNELPPVDITELLAKANSIKQNENKEQHHEQNGFTGPYNRSTTIETSQPSGLGADRTITADDSKEEPEDKQADTPTVTKEDFSYPPGFVGELARYFYDSAIRPVHEIALVSAMALSAGVLGRGYNISNTGLNQYYILVANTGTGKEGIKKSIERMIAAVRMQVPGADQFIGPSVFASGQAVSRVLDKQPCFISMIGEFGLTLQDMCDPKANGATRMLKKMLLDLYSYSGFSDVLRPSAYSDQEKNTQMIQAPCLSIIGETTPSTFFDHLDFTMIADGFIPRFTIVEYKGPRPQLNEKAGAPPTLDLINKFGRLCATAMNLAGNRTFVPIQTDADAAKVLKKFEVYCTNNINSKGDEIDKQLWNRAHLKALKLAGLVAVGCDPDRPVVTLEIANWALDFTYREVANISSKFAREEIGTGQGRQEGDLRRAIEDYINMTPKQRGSYLVCETLRDKPLVPFSFLRRRMQRVASFTTDRRGLDAALESMLKAMCNAESLVQVPGNEAFLAFKVRTPVYGLGQSW